MPIQITARRDGFRRCGMAHSDKTQTYPDGHFTPAQLQELESESQLIVVRIDNSQPAVISSGPTPEDVLADHLELQRRASIIEALSEQLAIELNHGASLQQELEALKVPPVPAPDDQVDKQTGDPAGDDKATNSQAKTKK
ncbi:HI1506-related protein [Serratia sp. IR-2025]